MTVAELDLELDVFAGPFDLLLAVVLREEVDLLEVELGEVVVAYVEYLEREFEGAGYGDFKAAVADGVVELLAPVRERYEALRPDEATLEATLAAGAEKASAIAAATMVDVRARMGFG